MIQKLTGIFAPMTTPFDKNGEADRAAFEFNCRAHMKAGLNGLVVAGIAYLWKGQLLLSLVLGLALWLNMLVAAVVGTLVPIALKTFRVDPAIASSVIITTFTDVFGFFSFLGLATLLIRFLL